MLHFFFLCGSYLALGDVKVEIDNCFDASGPGIDIEDNDNDMDVILDSTDNCDTLVNLGQENIDTDEDN